MHHTGSQENEVGPEEPEEIQEQEPPEAQEPGEDVRITDPARLRKASPGAF